MDLKTRKLLRKQNAVYETVNASIRAIRQEAFERFRNLLLRNQHCLPGTVDAVHRAGSTAKATDIWKSDVDIVIAFNDLAPQKIAQWMSRALDGIEAVLQLDEEFPCRRRDEFLISCFYKKGGILCEMDLLPTCRIEGMRQLSLLPHEKYYDVAMTAELKSVISTMRYSPPKWRRHCKTVVKVLKRVLARDIKGEKYCSFLCELVTMHAAQSLRDSQHRCVMYEDLLMRVVQYLAHPERLHITWGHASKHAPELPLVLLPSTAVYKNVCKNLEKKWPDSAKRLMEKILNDPSQLLDQVALAEDTEWIFDLAVENESPSACTMLLLQHKRESAKATARREAQLYKARQRAQLTLDSDTDSSSSDADSCDSGSEEMYMSDVRVDWRSKEEPEWSSDGAGCVIS